MASRQKPTVTELGVDIATLDWQRSGVGDGSFEVAYVSEAGRAADAGGSEGTARQAGPADAASAQWILLRVAGDPASRVLVYDRVEWLCFIDGARGGEFDLGRAERAHGGQAPREPGRPARVQQNRMRTGTPPSVRCGPCDSTGDRRQRRSGAYDSNSCTETMF